MKEPSGKGHTGSLGESIAASFLRKRGYEILDRNFRCPLGEIDLIAKEAGEIVFVEVKSRSGTSFGFPEEQIPWKKRRKLLRLAEFYLKRRRREEAARIDIVTVLFGEKGSILEIGVVQNAIGGSG